MHYTLIPLAFHGLKKYKHITNVLVAPLQKVLAFGPLFFHTALEHPGCPLTERPGCPKDIYIYIHIYIHIYIYIYMYIYMDKK